MQRLESWGQTLYSPWGKYPADIVIVVTCSQEVKMVHR